MIWSIIGSIGGNIFDPNAITEAGYIGCFAEPLEAMELLTYKRGGVSVPNRPLCGPLGSYPMLPNTLEHFLSSRLSTKDRLLGYWVF